MAENAAKLEAQTPNPELVLPALFDAQAHTFAEMHFIHRYNGAILPNQPNRNFVLLSFPDEYVRQIEALVYPPWYAACFMQDCSNPAIWGTYGDGHRNVCLKFKVRDKSGVPILRLRAKVGWSSRQKRTTQDWSQSFHAHRLPPLGRIGIVSPTDARDGVVDEDVHSAEPGHDRGTRVLDPPRVSDVDRHRKDGTVARCDRRRVASGRVEIKAGQHNRHPASANRLHIARRCRALRR